MRMPDFTIPLAGMAHAETRVNTVAARISRMGASVSDPQDTVDLSAEMVALMDSKNNFEANVKVAHTFDEMSRTTLDILA
jgi:flagellar basal body rod protein FlgF